jgi:hypothetical protein
VNVSQASIRAALACAALSALCVAPLAAQTTSASYLSRPQVVGGNPGPAHNYVCPNADGGPAIDCYLDAVRHLYTMCKHVKSIEIIEFGFEKSGEGTNSTKSEYCVDKQKSNIARPYQAALREANLSKPIVESLRTLHEFWLGALASLKWQPGESDEDYGVRTGMVFPGIDEQVDAIRAALADVREALAATRQKARR